MKDAVFIVGAIRTPVSPRRGALAKHNATTLGRYAINGLLEQIQLPSGVVEHCILGNALYAGGNPARLSALAANIPESVPALTIDSQCCSGLDSILIACNLIESGRFDFIVAGGAESYSTAPRRLKRAGGADGDIEYHRPPFSPWPNKDPDMLEAAAMLAKEFKISRVEQEEYARTSHAKARAAISKVKHECVEVSGVQKDDFTRQLDERVQSRLPILCGEEEFGITASTTAVEADASAACAIVSGKFLEAHEGLMPRAIRILGGASVGGDPGMPGLAPIRAVKQTLGEQNLNIVQIGVIEIMEAFASQAIACIKQCDMEMDKVNLGGGALARGHPIGASGTINVVRLYHEMMASTTPKFGLATIAGAGGLGSALVLNK